MTEYVDSFAWYPSRAHAAQSQLRSLMDRCDVLDIQTLHALSVNNPSRYWDNVSQILGLGQHALEVEKNLLAACVREWTGNYGTALVQEDEEGNLRQYSYTDLRKRVDKAVGGLAAAGVRKGDTIALLLPLYLDAVAILLACATMGIICAVLSPLERDDLVARALDQVRAKVVIVADRFNSGKVKVYTKSVADRASVTARSLDAIVTIRFSGEGTSWLDGRDMWWDNLIERGSTNNKQRKDHSGDSSPQGHWTLLDLIPEPDQAVSVAPVSPLRSAHDLAFIFDVHPKDVVLWWTSAPGVWDPWAVIGTLILGATLVIPKLSSERATIAHLFHLINSCDVSVLGCETSLVDHWTRQDTFQEQHTGAPLTTKQWQWAFINLGRGNSPVINYYRNRRLGVGLLGCMTLMPIKAGAFTGPIAGVIITIDSDNQFTADVPRLATSINRSLPSIGSIRSLPAAHNVGHVRIDSDGYWFLDLT